MTTRRKPATPRRKVPAKPPAPATPPVPEPAPEPHVSDAVVYQYPDQLPASVREAMAVPLYGCEDCGWKWPTPGEPPAGAECDNCGGAMVRGGEWRPAPAEVVTQSLEQLPPELRAAAMGAPSALVLVQTDGSEVGGRIASWMLAPVDNWSWSDERTQGVPAVEQNVTTLEAALKWFDVALVAEVPGGELRSMWARRAWYVNRRAR